MTDVNALSAPVDHTKIVVAIGTGAAALLDLYSARKVRETVDEVKAAVFSGGKFKVRATGYWPFSAKDSEKAMEGGTEGAASWNGKRVVDPQTGKRIRLRTLEEHLSLLNPAPYVSVSGDPEIFPFGQKLVVNWFDRTVTARVVDTGGHFRGAGKVYRVFGEEPLDFCVASAKTPIPKKNVVATIVRGDNFEGGKLVAVEKLKGQSVVVGAYLHGISAALL